MTSVALIWRKRVVTSWQLYAQKGIKSMVSMSADTSAVLCAEFSAHMAHGSGGSTAKEGLAGNTWKIDNSFLTRAQVPDRLWLIVLNQTLPLPTAHLWGQAHSRVCADGGANHIHDELPTLLSAANLSAGPARCLPSAIIGDLDSIREPVRVHYERQGVPCIDESHDQESTDLQKALRHVLKRMAEEAGQRADVGGPEAGGGGGEDVVVVVGAIGGRLDHTLANLSVLYAWPALPLVLVGEGNIVRLLRPGTTRVRVSRSEEGCHCGVVPLGGPARVTSRGLRWDMDGHELHMSGMLSTSNQVASGDVTITCDAPCLWITTEAEPPAPDPLPCHEGQS